MAKSKSPQRTATRKPGRVRPTRQPKAPRALRLGMAIGILIHGDSRSEIARAGRDMDWINVFLSEPVGGTHLEDGLALHSLVRQSDPVNELGTMVLRMYSSHAAPVRGPVFLCADAEDFSIKPLGDERADDLMTLLTIAWCRSRNPDLMVFDPSGRVI